MLDQNLFTLIVTPSKEDPNVVDLAEPSGTIHYRKQRIPGPIYKAEVYDFTTESLLVTATAPSATSKTKTLELCNPSSTVELKHTGTLTFRWSFKWEEHEFEWKREECYLIRKPDPPVLVAITKEPAGRLKTGSVQVLDYNLNRFDVNDRKGLEIVILTALLTFHDSNEAYHAEKESGSRKNSAADTTHPIVLTPPPPPPPKPAPKTGVDRIAEMQAIRGEVNEVTVEDEGAIDDYAAYCWNLLQDDAMLFVTVRSHTVLEVQKVVQVVEETKRLRHKAGFFEDLNQYVVYETKPSGPKRINLDDGSKNKKNNYEPPTSLSIHLSKIPMPELQPKPNTQSDRLFAEALMKKDNKDRKKGSSAPSSPSQSPSSSTISSPSPQLLSKANKLFRPRSSSPKSHVHAHQVHPNQPSPSPAQLNNPLIYVAPPPVPRYKSHPNHPTSSPPSSGFAPGALNVSGVDASPSSPPKSPSAASNAISGFLEKFHL